MNKTRKFKDDIFGYQWSDIQAMQQGTYQHKTLTPLTKPRWFAYPMLQRWYRDYLGRVCYEGFDR